MKKDGHHKKNIRTPCGEERQCSRHSMKKPPKAWQKEKSLHNSASNAHSPAPERRPDKKQRRDIIKFKTQ